MSFTYPPTPEALPTAPTPPPMSAMETADDGESPRKKVEQEETNVEKQERQLELARREADAKIAELAKKADEVTSSIIFSLCELPSFSNIFVPLFLCLFVPSFLYLLVPFVCLFLCSFICLCICLFVCLLFIFPCGSSQHICPAPCYASAELKKPNT